MSEVTPSVAWKDGDIEGVVVSRLVRHTDQRGWLSEVFRSDETDAAVMPVMAYVSVTRPGVARGPHEHTDQTDMFAMLGPGRFKLRLWDHRPSSPTRGKRMTLLAGDDNPLAVIVPPGVVHGYLNVADGDGWVINCPNRLFAGPHRRQPVDEIRHENDAHSVFSMED